MVSQSLQLVCHLPLGLRGVRSSVQHGYLARIVIEVVQTTHSDPQAPRRAHAGARNVRTRQLGNKMSSN